MSALFTPTHLIRFTFETGIYGEVDVHLDADETGNGPAYRESDWALGEHRWERRDGRWLIDGSTRIGGKDVEIEVRELSKISSQDMMRTFGSQIMARHEAIEAIRQIMLAKSSPAA